MASKAKARVDATSSSATRSPGHRIGLTDSQIIDAALELIDDGCQSLTFADVARRLDVRLPSLYTHVKGFDELKRLMRIRVSRELNEYLHDAALNRRGSEGLREVLSAARKYAVERPGRWLVATNIQIDEHDSELELTVRYGRASVHGFLRSFGIAESDLNYWEVFVWSWTYGYINLELTFNSTRFTETQFVDMLDEVVRVVSEH